MGSTPARSAWAETDLSGLGLPEPPGDLAERVRDLGDLRAGTRPGAPALRGLGTFALEAEARDPEEYVLAGVEEIALGLLALHYIVSYGHLFLALQVLVDADETVVITDAARAGLAAAADLQRATIEAAARGTLVGPGKLVVVDGPYGQRSWKWTGVPPREGGGGVAGAAEFLGSLR